MRIRRLVVLIAALWAAIGFQRSAQAFVRHPVDDRELADVRAASPAAAEAYVQAEARLRAGDWVGAEKLLASARALRPVSFLLARRHCQVLTELGRRDAALAACLAAESGETAMDERAYVGAWMSGNQLALPKDLFDAVREASNARRLVGQPFADAAFCEIAHHIGDDAMYSSCLAGLEKNAPGYFETARWKAARPGAPGWLYWAAWSMLAALGAFTLGHAFLRWFRNPAPRVRKAGTAAVVGLALSAAFAGPARADEPAPSGAQPHWQLSHFNINFEDPESHIPTIQERNDNALEFGYFLQDLAAEALKAERKQDYRQAIKFWRASAKAVPDEAVGFTRACRDYQLVDEREHALEYCSHALNLHGVTTVDYVRFGELMVAKPTALTELEVQDLQAAITHLTAQPNGEGPAAVIECELGVKLGDEARLSHCTSVLAKTTPNDPHTLTFQWSLAMRRRNYAQARSVLDQMGKASMAPEALTQLRAATDEASAWWKRPFQDPRYGFGLVCLIGLCAVFLIRKRAQLRDASSPGDPSSSKLAAERAPFNSGA